MSCSARLDTGQNNLTKDIQKYIYHIRREESVLLICSNERIILPNRDHRWPTTSPEIRYISFYNYCLFKPRQMHFFAWARSIIISVPHDWLYGIILLSMTQWWTMWTLGLTDALICGKTHFCQILVSEPNKNFFNLAFHRGKGLGSFYWTPVTFILSFFSASCTNFEGLFLKCQKQYRPVYYSSLWVLLNEKDLAGKEGGKIGYFWA